MTSTIRNGYVEIEQRADGAFFGLYSQFVPNVFVTQLRRGDDIYESESTTQLFSTSVFNSDVFDPEIALHDLGLYAAAGVIDNSTSTEAGSGWQLRLYNNTGGQQFSVFYGGSSFSNQIPTKGIGLAALSGLNTMIAWSSDGLDGDGYGIGLRIYNAAGLLTTERVLFDGRSGDQYDPELLVLQNGNVALGFTDSNSGTDQIRLGIYDQTGALVSFPVTLSNAALPASQIELKQLNNGNIVAVWIDEVNGGAYMRMTNAAGVPVGPAVMVNGAGVAPLVTAVGVSELTDGGFVIGWNQDTDVFFRKFTASGATDGPRVDAQMSSTSSLIEIEVEGLVDGGFVISSDRASRVFEQGTGVSDFFELSTPSQVMGAGGPDIVLGSAGADTIWGEEGVDIINGRGGDDYIDAGDGLADQFQFLDGGAGNDTLISDGEAVIEGGDGNDWIRGSGSAESSNPFDLYFDSGSNGLTQGGGNNLNAGASDRLIGGDGADVIFARSGHDYIEGGLGDDLIFSGTGEDTVKAGGGHDRVFLRGDQTHTEGGWGNDTIRGGFGQDEIFGNGGNDVLIGRAGDDTLRGDAGADVFVFVQLPELQVPVEGLGLVSFRPVLGNDTVLDFENGTDRLRIDDAFASNFAALDWYDVGANVLIEFQQDATVTLLGMGGRFDASDVVFV